MKIKTCFFVLTLGLCNLLRGGELPSMQKIIDRIKSFNFLKKEEIYAMCHILNEGDGLYYWICAFGEIQGSDFTNKEQVKFLSSLLTLGVLQVETDKEKSNKKNYDLINNIQCEFNMLKEAKENHPEDFNEDNLGFIFEDLENEYKKRYVQVQTCMQMKETENLQAEPIQAKKRKLQTR